MVFPFPEVKNPVTPGLAVAVQEKVAPAKSAVRFTKEVCEPEQITCESGVVVNCGIGFTVKVRVLTAEAPHSLVTINETVYVPGVAYEICPGLAVVAVAGTPPGKLQA